MKGPILVVCEDRAHLPPYMAALRAGGLDGEALVPLVPENEPSGVRELARRAAGLVLGGGPDIQPWRYGETPLAAAQLDLLPALDTLEWDALAGAREARVPVWAVCRGLQALNVFFGGTLYQDIPLQVPGAVDHGVMEPLDALVHEILVAAAAGAFARLLRSGPTRVNSRHHQAISSLAADLAAVAQAPDGLVEAAAGRFDDWWVRGVQWHPEDLLDHPLHRTLWQDFAAAAGAPPGAAQGAFALAARRREPERGPRA